jgi:hypothetical protein
MKCPYVPQVNLSLYNKCVCYISVKVFNSIPNRITDLEQNRKLFIGKSFPSVPIITFLSYTDHFQNAILTGWC